MAVQCLIPLSVVLFSSAKALFFYLQYNVKNFFGELVGSVLSEKSKLINVGGTIEQALVGQYKINSKAVLSEAWSNTKKSRMSINLALLFVLVLGIIVSLVASSFFGGIELILQQAQVPEQNSQALQIINIIVTIMIWPFIVQLLSSFLLCPVSKNEPCFLTAPTDNVKCQTTWSIFDHGQQISRNNLIVQCCLISPSTKQSSCST